MVVKSGCNRPPDISPSYSGACSALANSISIVWWLQVLPVGLENLSLLMFLAQ